MKRTYAISLLLLFTLATSCSNKPSNPQLVSATEQRMLSEDGQYTTTAVGPDAFQVSSSEASGSHWHAIYIVKGKLEKEAFDFRDEAEWKTFIDRYKTDSGSSFESGYGELGRIVNPTKKYVINSSVHDGSYSARLYYRD